MMLLELCVSCITMFWRVPRDKSDDLGDESDDLGDESDDMRNEADNLTARRKSDDAVIIKSTILSTNPFCSSSPRTPQYPPRSPNLSGSMRPPGTPSTPGGNSQGNPNSPYTPVFLSGQSTPKTPNESSKPPTCDPEY